jgi:hypothetical protein
MSKVQGSLLAAAVFLAVCAPAQNPSGSVQPLRDELARLTPLLAAPPAARSAQQPPEEIAAARRDAMIALMRLSPGDAFQLALSPAQRAALIARDSALEPFLERHGQWSGSLESLAVDETPGQGRIVTYILDPSARLEVHSIGRPLPTDCGWRAEVQGVALGGVAAGFVTALEKSAGAGDCSNLGEQKVLAVAISFPNKPLSLTNAQIEEALFSPSAPSLDHYWRENSAGAAWVSGKVVSLALNRAYSCQETNELADAVFEALAARENLTQYRRVFFFFALDNQDPCGFGGLGTVNCWQRSVQGALHWLAMAWLPVRPATDRPWLFRHATLHEAGHMLGLLHANSRRFSRFALGARGQLGAVVEYGDPFTLMGTGTAPFSLRQRYQVGWLPESQILRVESPGSYTIDAVASPSPSPKAMRIRRIPGADDWLWIEYHRPQGVYYANWPTGAPAGALVYLEDDANRDSSSTNAGAVHLLDMTPGSQSADMTDAMLAPNSLWQDAFSSLNLRVDSAADRLSLTVSREAPCASVQPASRRHGPGAESGEFQISAPGSCRWEVVNPEPWVTLSGASSGLGPATIAYRLDSNATPTRRTAYLSIARSPAVIEQLPVNQPPVPVSVDPGEGRGPAAFLRFNIQDPNGIEDVTQVRVLVNTDPRARGGCLVEYDVASNQIRLATDDGAGWLGPRSNPPSLENSQCRIQSFSAYASAPG